MHLDGVVASLHEIPGGKEGTKQTLRMMRALVRDGKRNLQVRATALKLVSHLPPKSWSAEVKALFYFVRDKIRFVRDINGIETLHTPEKVLDFGQGDCDDKSILLASLLESIGHPTRFVAVGPEQDQFSHVLVETKIGDRWLPLETTENVEPGWFPEKYPARLIIYN